MAVRQPRNNRYLNLCVLAALVVPGWCAAAATQIRPGEWEVTVRMEMPGMPAQAMAQQTHTSKSCVTPEMASDPRAAAERLNNHNQSGTKCAMADYAISGNTSTWSIECTGAHPAHMDGEMIYDSDTTHHGTTKIAMQGPRGPMQMTQVIEAHRIGDCKP